MTVYCGSCTGPNENLLQGEYQTFVVRDLCLPGIADPDDTTLFYVHIERIAALGAACGDWRVEVDGDWAGPAGTPQFVCNP